MKTNVFSKFIGIFACIMILGITSSVAYGASVSIAAGSTNMTIGSSTTLTIRGNDVIGKVTITSSNPDVISLDSSGGWLEGSLSLKAYAKSAGTAYITVKSVDTASASTGEAVSVSTGVNITAKAAVVDTRSSDNYLSSLSVEGYELSPAFNANTLNYELSVASDVNEIKVAAIPSNSKATTVIDGNLDLVAGENNVVITVTAENGYKRNYTIIVKKEKNPDDINAKVKELTISNAKLKSEFSPEVHEYMCDDITSDVQKLDIMVKTEIEDLKYEITGNDELKQGINHIKIKSISKDGSASEEYEIIVFKTDETLALQDVEVEEEIVPTVSNSTSIIDRLKSHKKEFIIAGAVVILLILIIISYVIFRILKNRKGKDDFKSDIPEDNNFNKNEVESVRVRKGSALNVEMTNDSENIEEIVKLKLPSDDDESK